MVRSAGLSARASRTMATSSLLASVLRDGRRRGRPPQDEAYHRCFGTTPCAKRGVGGTPAISAISFLTIDLPKEL